MALDNVIQQPHYQNLIIGGLAPDEIIVGKEELMPLKDIVDSFVLCMLQRITDWKIVRLMN